MKFAAYMVFSFITFFHILSFPSVTIFFGPMPPHDLVNFAVLPPP